MSLWNGTADEVFVAAPVARAGSPSLEHSADGAMMNPPQRCRRGVRLASRLGGQLGCDLLLVTSAMLGLFFLYGPLGL